MPTRIRYLFELTAVIVAILLVLWASFPWLVNLVIKLPANLQAVGLNYCGLLLAGMVAGSFNLSYEKTVMESAVHRWLAHCTKFMMYLAIGLLFEAASIIFGVTPGFHLDPLVIIAMLCFSSLLAYNYWDLARHVLGKANTSE